MTIINQKHDNKVNEATQAVQNRTEDLKDSQYRLFYHFMAPSSWINDPNGLIQHKGVYHLFYQHYPYGVDWGPMHWGHATSTDLVHWKHEPLALAPSEDYEYEEGNTEVGCFSGSAVSNGDELCLIYTGHVEGKSPKEIQALASSEDGIHFTKHEQNPIISGPPADFSEDFRDPKVWKYEGIWYMVVGSSRNGNGAIPLFKSTDLVNWTYIAAALEGDGTQGDMWECPDLFPLDDKHMLITSPMNMDDGKNMIMVGDMDYDNGKFHPESVKEIDDGFDFYAAQTFEDERGRRILIAWMDTWETEFPTKTEGWSGAMTIPRQVFLDENQDVSFLPVPELEVLREQHHFEENLSLSSGKSHDLNKHRGLEHSYEINLDIILPENQTSGRVGLELRASMDGSENTLVYYDVAAGELVVDTTRSGGKTPQGLSKTKIEVEDKLSLRLFMDASSLEVFTANGRSWITSRIYPESSHKGVNVYTEGTEAYVEKVDTWVLMKVLD
ncbi:MAG: glycoside hydrolase family 32 protein [Halobacillus sp.]|uniref:glycoside hydrolase family 32 protein n=1 Tax=Halobacillus sp. TaxID=56800 RepID=UPI003BAFCC1B